MNDEQWKSLLGITSLFVTILLAFSLYRVWDTKVVTINEKETILQPCETLGCPTQIVSTFVDNAILLEGVRQILREELAAKSSFKTGIVTVNAPLPSGACFKYDGRFWNHGKELTAKEYEECKCLNDWSCFKTIV